MEIQCKNNNVFIKITFDFPQDIEKKIKGKNLFPRNGMCEKFGITEDYIDVYDSNHEVIEVIFGRKSMLLYTLSNICNALKLLPSIKILMMRTYK